MANIQWALNHFKEYSKAYEKFEDYYDGEHISVFRKYAARKVIGMLADVFDGYCDNLTPSIVNTYSDRLQIGEFTTTNTSAKDIIDKVWKLSKLDIKSSAIHRDTIKLGDCYVIVWYDKNGNPRVYHQDTENIAVRYDDDDDIIEAVKIWCENEYQRITIYTPISIERYITKTPKVKIKADLSNVIPYDGDGEAVIVNPFGQVPVFRFANDCSDYAQSELKDVIKLQDSLNWALIYMFLAAVNEALPIRAIFGVEANNDPETGLPIPIQGSPGQILEISDPSGKLVQLDGANLEQFLKIQNDTRAEMARVSSTPMHALMLNNGDFPSGTALRTAEAPLLSKVKDGQISFGDTWEQIMTFACKISNVAVDDIVCNWRDTSPDNSKEDSEVMINKIAIGVSKEQALTELGYSTEQIEQFKIDNGANIDNIVNTI